MAQIAATQTSEFGGFLRAEQAAPYFEAARKSSVVQMLARQVPVGPNGVEIPVVTSKPSAAWVSEGGQKPTTQGAMALKTMKPAKIAAITVVSSEIVRANPGGYVDMFRDDIAEAFAKAFDAAALHGVSSPFTTNLDQTTKAVELGTAARADGGVYADLNAALSMLVKDHKKLTGYAFDSIVEPTLNGAVDLNGRPLFVEPVYESRALTTGRLLGRPAALADGVATADGKSVVGYAGDWSQVIWGTVGGISYDISTEAAVTLNGQLVSLWEHNLVALRAEAEFAFLVNDPQSFVKLTDATA